MFMHPVFSSVLAPLLQEGKTIQLLWIPSVMATPVQSSMKKHLYATIAGPHPFSLETFNCRPNLLTTLNLRFSLTFSPSDHGHQDK